jgi:N-acetylglucosamine malate deacetylase 2
MRILYIYPHPDDESFGTAHVMNKQVRDGHDVYLLTLTKGGATRQRHKFGYSVEQMGEIRYKEMLCVKKVLGLTGLKVLDLPDSGLKEMDPIEIENIIEKEISELKPDVVVTYAVHGISGFHDHLVSHAVVKRVFSGMLKNGNAPKRLAFHTLREEDAKSFSVGLHLNGSKAEEIDCVVKVENEDIKKAHDALDCYETYQEFIQNTGIKNYILRECYFEFYKESFSPPADDLFSGL